MTPKPMWRCSSRETFSMPSENPGIVPAFEVVLDEVLAGLGERRLDDHVVKRDRLGESRQRAVAAELVGHPVEPGEHVAVAPPEL